MRGDQIVRYFLTRFFQSKQKVNTQTNRNPVILIITCYVVDNGDNDGQIIEEYYDSGNNTEDSKRCIQSWIGNMRCDAQNN